MVESIIDFILHIDVHLGQIISTYGIATYAILFVIIFIETGLVITPFLPGDSLLFVSGAFAAQGFLNVLVLMMLLTLAAILGDTANYGIGHFLGKKVVTNHRRLINEKHIAKTEQFFQRHGGKTIIIARFLPIVRTIAPFLAGAGRMPYGKFLFYNIIGGIIWIVLGIMAGYFFGNIKFVKNNFSLFVLGIVVVSSIPIILQFMQSRQRDKHHLLKNDKNPMN